MDDQRNPRPGEPFRFDDPANQHSPGGQSAQPESDEDRQTFLAPVKLFAGGRAKAEGDTNGEEEEEERSSEVAQHGFGNHNCLFVFNYS